MIEETVIPGYMHPLLQEMIQIMESAAFNDAKRSEELLRPCMMLKPPLSFECYGESTHPTIWVARYGEVVAGGKTPAEAYENFDKAWIGEDWRVTL